MNTKNNWIKMTDRRPTEEDYPLWAFWTHAPTTPMLLTYADGGNFTHWRPAAQDIPEPPREETQRDKDSTAYVQWLNDRTSSEDSAWHAALAYERAEVAKMLPDNSKLWSLDGITKTIEAIRARCAGGGK